MERFSRMMSEPGVEVPVEHARKGGEVWEFVKKKIEEQN